MAVATVDFDFVGDGVPRRLSLGQTRRRKLLSATQLGKKSGVAASTILSIEGGAKPRLSTIAKLARALGVAAEDIDWPGDPLGLTEDEGQGDE